MNQSVFNSTSSKVRHEGGIPLTSTAGADTATVGHDGPSVTNKGSEANISALANEVMVATQQRHIVPDGRTIDTTANSRRRDAMLELSQRDVSPYFSKAKDNSM